MGASWLRCSKCVRIASIDRRKEKAGINNQTLLTGQVREQTASG